MTSKSDGGRVDLTAIEKEVSTVLKNELLLNSTDIIVAFLSKITYGDLL